MRGKLPSRVLGLVVEWASTHQEDLNQNWNLCEQHEQPIQIDPLV
jgi:hypothetical protein